MITWEVLKSFSNLVFCRRNVTQEKALRIWNQYIKPYLPLENIYRFETEWSHYYLGELDYDEFGQELKKIENYLLTNNILK